MSSLYGNPEIAPPYQRPFQQQSWQQQQQQTPNAGQNGSSYYGQPAPSFYDQQEETQYYHGPQAPSSYYAAQQPYSSSYFPHGQTNGTPYGEQTTYYRQPSRSHFPPGTESEIVRVFEKADLDRSGTIDAMELGRVLSTEYGSFSPRTVRRMLHLYADDKNNTTCIGPAGFVPLWRAIRHWQIVFERFDRDRSGTIERNELQEALLSLRLDIPPQVLHMLVSTFDTTGHGRSIQYDNFIECGLIVKGLSEKFMEKDHNYSGFATLDYETFMLMVLPFIVA
ncbi:hypothetical protein BDL97_06G114900 [Sphagnum fallax]|nr:hypothetical protein BDL97_06G114900 [Sphagnum fallax]